ncbi:hypothetical protein [Alkalicoccobacillus murimartini]|uniref:Heme A synthase n=1 Tax=Alkalicoccobacillus murimartini TaxID=171685 RepID=A0ABT9YHQ0_9BACI|nr:hypothetical protein [Alkalicoccobacillus murimartini]MDQ0207396.1 heme A synthase [Alkalicoccobacillus murimartini]
MEWYNYVSLSILLLTTLFVLILTYKNKQSEEGKGKEFLSFLMLGVFSWFVAVGITNIFSLVLYAVSVIYFIVAAVLFLKQKESASN